jgi:pilus assembly protein CpaB
MKRRVLSGVAAVVLAAVGAVLLLSYVGAADQRAMAGLQTVNVLVVTKQIAKGTSADELQALVTSKQLPAVAVPSGAVSELSQLVGQVATSELEPGEQLLASRFADASTLPNAGQVAVPRGLQEVSVSLDAQRVVGGHLIPGATVGVFLSLPKDGNRPAQTHLLLHRVLVSRVEGGIVLQPTDGQEASPTASTNGVMVTLAVTSAHAEEVVFGAEHGTLWLSLEPAGADETGTRVVTQKNVNK